MTCQSSFIYDQERQRSLQHYIKINDLPGPFKQVFLPSGKFSSQDQVGTTDVCRYLCCLWLWDSSSKETNSVPDTGTKFDKTSRHLFHVLPFPCLSPDLHVRHRQLGQLPHKPRGSSRKVMTNSRYRPILSIIPLRMALLVTLFLVLINIFNSVR